MTPALFFGICFAGGIGAALRFVVDWSVKSRTRMSYPVGTAVVNVSGSFLLGVVTGLAVHMVFWHGAALVVGTGLLGGYTTFSTASFETVRLAQERRYIATLTNGFGTLALSTAAAATGYLIGTLQ